MLLEKYNIQFNDDQLPASFAQMIDSLYIFNYETRIVSLTTIDLKVFVNNWVVAMGHKLDIRKVYMLLALLKEFGHFLFLSEGYED